MVSYYVSWHLALMLPFILFIFAIPIIQISHKGNKIIKYTILIILFSIIITIIWYSLRAIDINESEVFFNQESYLSSASPEILEKFIPENCLVITPFSITLTVSTDLNVMSLSEAKENKLDVENNCIYFFED